MSVEKEKSNQFMDVLVIELSWAYQYHIMYHTFNLQCVENEWVSFFLTSIMLMLVCIYAVCYPYNHIYSILTGLVHCLNINWLNWILQAHAFSLKPILLMTFTTEQYVEFDEYPVSLANICYLLPSYQHNSAYTVFFFSSPKLAELKKKQSKNIWIVQMDTNSVN